MKMKKLFQFFIISVIVFIVFAKNVSAFSFPNPDPTVLGDDIDGPGYFIQSDLVLSFELFDVGDPVPGGSTFGFLFEGADVTDSANLHTIFDPLDATGDLAIVSFPTGQIIDDDEAIVQGTFTGSGNIGFFLTPHPLFGLPTLFSDPLLNPGGTDVALAFPFLDPSLGDFVLAFGFDAFDPAIGTFPVVFAMEAIGGITPVPEPSTLLLLGSGLLGLALYGRKRFKGLIRK